jgi:hypothetical protein
MKWKSRIKLKIRLWWMGKAMTRRINPPNPQGGIRDILNGTETYREYHWSARMARWLFQDPKWLIPTIISIIALLKD